MTEKRYTTEEWDIWDYADSILVIFQDGEFISNKDVVDLLNEQDKEIKELSDTLDNMVDFKNKYRDKYKQLKKENEQLKQDVEYWKRVANQCKELNIFEHCKKYKTECKDEHIYWSSD